VMVGEGVVWLEVVKTKGILVVADFCSAGVVWCVIW